MTKTIRVEALRESHIRVKKINSDDGDSWINLTAGEYSDDIEFVLALEPNLSDLPEDFLHLENQGLQKVIHPSLVGERTVTFDTIALTRLS